MTRVVPIRSWFGPLLGLAFVAAGLGAYFYDGPWRGQRPPDALFVVVVVGGAIATLRGALGARVDREGDVVRLRVRAWHFGLVTKCELRASDVDSVRVTTEKHSRRPGHHTADTYALTIATKSGATTALPVSFGNSGAALRVQLAIEALLRD